MPKSSVSRGLRRIAHLTALCAATLSALPALAQRTTIGPFLDLQESVSALSGPNKHMTKTKVDVEGGLVAVGSFGGGPINIYFQPASPLTPCGTHPFTMCNTLTFIDWITISPLGSGSLPDPIPVKGLSYLSYDYGDRTGQMQVTTLYGQDVSNGSRLQMASFDPARPQLAFSGEQIVGRSGATYDASFSAAVSLNDLGAVLGPGFDVSGISGNPNGRIYAFQTTLPIGEIMPSVPEPASYALMAGGLALIGLARRRARPGAPA